MTITPYFCAQTCRAHGFKYAALWDKGCHCGSSLDYTTTGGANVTLSNLIDANSDTVCTTGADNNQWPPCGGDRRENCGSNRGARIFVDPSFPDERKLTDFAIIAQGYALLGCFKNARFPSAVDSVTSVSVQSTATCLQYCADLGMPYAYMARDANQGNINCNCGSEFNKKTSQVSSDTNGCSEHCSDPSQRTGCTGQDCCGSGSGPFPVYANPQLMGCFTPIIPGMANPDVDDPAPDGYDCFPTPRSIQARAASPVVKYAARTMSASASFVATASPAANAFVNYGCWQNTLVGDLLDAVTTATIPNNTINVDTCVKFCDSNNHRFAALYGAPPNSQCACGDTLKSNVTPNGAMEDCNQPCPGSAQQNCGGDKGPLLYARSDVTPNQWAQLYTSSWSHTVVYSCTSSACKS
ncbi:hypothetical protein F4825DRAFT_320217 [Nemania diffusa]|nr:hypothetical protein F4825DRAFT_320217 [Nemania diffusa]